MTTHYQTLAIEPTATPEMVREAYRKAASCAHPDKGGTVAAMQAVNAAYAVLSDPQKRQAYDATIPKPKPKGYVYTMSDVGFAARGENFGQH